MDDFWCEKLGIQLQKNRIHFAGCQNKFVPEGDECAWGFGHFR
jgi:hypothetical protein